MKSKINSPSDQLARPLPQSSIYYYNIIIILLQDNDYVIFSFDDSKAFDTSGHSTLLHKMGAMDLPDLIYNWMVNYFEHRGHITRHQGKELSFAEINASVVQGSVVGPLPL